MAQHDMKSANQDYASFVNMFKWSMVSIALVVALVIILIS